jgi:pimeloyl-ACP methyl ester carboxylesterase
MPKDTQHYQQPMQPWPTLTSYGNIATLSQPPLELFYFEAGQPNQPHLVMLHGLGDEADTWRHVFLPLAENYHTLALDLPGFGRSDKPDVDYTPEFMLDSILGLLDQSDVSKAILMGSSLGGILAHGLAVTNPDRVAGLILVGGALLQSEPMGDRSLRLMQLPLIGEWLYTRLRKDPDAAFNSLGNVYHDLEKLPESDREFLYTRVNRRVWSDGQRRAYFSTLRNLSPWVKGMQSSLSEQLKQLNIPTLVARGQFDGLFSETNADQILAIQPQAEKATVEQAGHLPHQENPQAFLSVIRPWLDRHF